MKSNLKCSFIIPGYKCDEFIFRNIESILDQDYRNYEIIVILNGEWQTKAQLHRGIEEKYGNGDMLRVFSFDRGHLGHANNLGIELATGDIISHLSSDLYLMPGTLRTWIETFEEHPECGFVYSGYKLVSPNPADVYYSDPWDRYHLECENFIDGANPYRRGLAVKWDTELKSLIDWNWALSLTDFGANGYYIKEPLYHAELPKPGGLTDDSNMNWEKRRRQIQAKHHIPDRKMCFCSLIEPLYALELAKMCEADFRNYPGHKKHHYDLIYQYGFPTGLEHIQISVGVFYQHWKHRVVHWTGQDILTFMQHRWADADYYVQMVLSKMSNHFCISEKDASVLRRMHLEPEVVFPPVKWEKRGTEVEGISVNDPELMHQLKKAMPDIQFKSNDLDCAITVHFQDSVSNILKSICKGNYVITEKYFPATYQIQGWTNVPEMRKMITHTIRQIQKTRPELSDKDLNYYRDRVNPTYFKNKLEKIAEKQVSKYARLEDIQVGTKGVFGEA